MTLFISANPENCFQSRLCPSLITPHFFPPSPDPWKPTCDGRKKRAFKNTSGSTVATNHPPHRPVFLRSNGVHRHQTCVCIFFPLQNAQKQPRLTSTRGSKNWAPFEKPIKSSQNARHTRYSFTQCCYACKNTRPTLLSPSPPPGTREIRLPVQTWSSGSSRKIQ